MAEDCSDLGGRLEKILDGLPIEQHRKVFLIVELLEGVAEYMATYAPVISAQAQAQRALRSPATTEPAAETAVVEVEVSNILDLLNCAEMYGHNNSVLVDGLFGMLDWNVSDVDIEAFCTDTFLTSEARSKGFGVEDFEESVTRLREMRDRYCPKPSQKKG